MRALPFSVVLTGVLTGCCMSSGLGGGGGSASGTSSGSSGCPADELTAIGTACSPEGRLCGVSDPRFTHFILCSNGVWVEMEAPPPPPSPSGPPIAPPVSSAPSPPPAP